MKEGDLIPRYYYDYESGKMYRPYCGKFKELGCLSKDGYLYFSPTRYKRKRLHRFIWECFFGEIPEGMQIDHINHNRLDNRLCNLRLVTPTENCRNTKLPKTNKSGKIGVFFDKVNNKWCASYYVKNKRIHIGRFKKFEDAVAAREDMERKCGYHKNHGRNL